MITESGIILVKIYMSISKKEQEKRFEDLRENPLKQWKLSGVDEKAQDLWDDYTEYKNKMFENTKNGGIAFKVIRANRKTEARIEAIEHVLQSIPYDINRPI
jgi:polyphosphate kinase 2 (PPK2 family)